jgi:surface carbohydrate biosynthesis protein
MKLTAKPAIYIPIESKKREFDGKILLTAALLRRGFRVLLGTKSGIHRELMHARSAVYLAKSVSNEHLDLYSALRQRGHRLAVLDVEGGALTHDIKSDLLRSYQPEAAPYFDFFYVFGEKIREAILRDLPYIREEQVLVTGEPRFDLLRPEFEGYHAEAMEEIRRRYGRFILINTSFGLSNSILGEEGIRHALETTHDIPDEQRHLYLLKHEEGKHLLVAFVEMAKHLAAKFPEISVVVRPHPDEDPDTYRRMAIGYPNLFVNGEGSVHPWIRTALAVIHHDCTTAMETVMAGKPAISYIPRLEESITAWLPIYLSIVCKELGEVVESVANIIDGRNDNPWSPGKEKEVVLSSYFSNCVHPAGELLSSALQDAYKNLHSKSYSSPTLKLKRLRSNLSLIRYRKNLTPGARERFLWIEPTEVIKKLKLTNLLLDSELITLKLLGGNVLLLTTNDSHK